MRTTTIFFHLMLALVITSVFLTVMTAMTPMHSLTFEQRWAPAANLRPSFDPPIRMLHRPLLDYPARVRTMVA